MKKLLASATLVTATFLLMGSSCSGGRSESSLAQLTASRIGGVKAAQVSISNVSGQGKTVNWTATTPKGVYSCSVNGVTRQVTVAKN